MLSNEDLSLEFPDHDFVRFEKDVGIKTRYLADNNTSALDLAIGACNLLLQKHDKKDIDFVLYCTQSPEYVLPSTACVLQDQLGLSISTGALDINLGCSGYTYCLSVAKGLIESNAAKNVLVVTSDTYSKYIDPKNRINRSLFGDAATATLIVQSLSNDIAGFLHGTDGSKSDKLILEKSSLESETKPYLHMNGPAIFDFTQNRMPLFINEILQKNSLDKSQVDQYILHQANKLLLDLIRMKVKVKKEKFFIDMTDGGNTVSSTIPIALKKYSNQTNASGSLPEKVLLAGFGVGLSWSGGIITLRHPL